MTLRSLFRVAGAATIVATIGTTAACSDAGRATGNVVLFKRLQFSQHAYNLATMAPYDTVRVHATAITSDGTPLTVPVSYTVTTATSNNFFHIDSTGLLHALAATPPYHQLALVATATYDGQTRRDTAYVSIIDTVPTVLTTSLHIPDTTDAVGVVGYSLDSLGVNNATYLQNTITVDVRGPNGVRLPMTLVSAWVTDTNVVGAGFGFLPLPWTTGWFAASRPEQASGGSENPLSLTLLPHAEGRTWLHFSTYVYGRTLTDSVPIGVPGPRFFTVQANFVPPLSFGTVKSKLVMQPAELTVSAGSEVQWVSPPITGNDSIGFAIAVTFDDTTGVRASRIHAYTDSQDPLDAVLNDLTNDWTDHAQSGNIPSFRMQQYPNSCFATNQVVCIGGHEARYFPNPGRYPYHVNPGNIPGVVIVK